MTDEAPETFSNGIAKEAKEELVATAVRAAHLQLILVALAAVGVIVASALTVFVGLTNYQLNERTKDCTESTGRCYQENQKSIGSAVQSILDYQRDLMAPHRLRNEAENICQVELFAGNPSYAAAFGVAAAKARYQECVLQASGGTTPPSIPPNPLTTTTTEGHR